MKSAASGEPRSGARPADSRRRRVLVRVSVGLLAMLALLPALPGVSNSTLFTLTLMLTSVAVAVNWNLTGGFTGYVDFGHAVWFGIGAYTTAILMSLQTNGPQIGWAAPPAIILGAVVAGVLAAAIGRATMRLKGPYFSIALLGTFVAVREIVRVSGGSTGGGVGLTLPPYLNRPLFYYLELALGGRLSSPSPGGSAVARASAPPWWPSGRTRSGRRCAASTPPASRSTVFSFAGFSTGLFGGTLGLPEHIRGPRHRLRRGAAPSTRSWATMLGGLGTVARPLVVGTVVLFWLRELLWAHLLDYHLIAQGALLIVIVLYLPRGLVGRSSTPRGTSVTALWRRCDRARRPTHGGSEREGTRDPPPRGPRRAEAVRWPDRRGRGGHRASVAGEMVGLIGPNGSGKTTLFDCLSRVTRHRLRIDRDSTATDITRCTSPHRGGPARASPHLPAHPGVPRPDRRGEHGVEHPVGARRSRRACSAAPIPSTPPEGRLPAGVPAARSASEDERAGALSGGQRRLLEIGMALMSEPKLILLDESTSGVNPTLVADIADRLRAVNAEGVAILLVEHNVQFVADLCERVVVLDQGAKLAEGSPKDIMKNRAVIEAYFGAEAGGGG